MTAKKIRCALPNKSWLICGTILATELKEPESRNNHHHIIGDPARIGPFIKKGLAKKKKPKKLQPKNQKKKTGGLYATVDSEVQKPEKKASKEDPKRTSKRSQKTFQHQHQEDFGPTNTKVAIESIKVKPNQTFHLRYQ